MKDFYRKMKHPISFFRIVIFIFSLFQSPYAFSQLVTCSVNAGATGEWCFGDTIRLDGNISGLIQAGTVQWTQTGGAPVLIINPNSLKARIAPPAAGTYTFKISAVCSQGVAEQTVTHTVLESAIPNAGPDQTVQCYTGGGIILSGFNVPQSGVYSYWSSPLGYFIGNTFFPDTLQFGDCGPVGGWFYVDYNFTNANCSRTDRKYIKIVNYIPEPKILIEGGCGSSYTVIGTCSGGGTINWDFLSPAGGGGSVFTNPSAISSELINLVNNQEYIIRYSINSGCGLFSVTDTFVAMIGGGLAGFNPSTNSMKFCEIPEEIVLSPPQVPDISKNEYGYWFQKSDCFNYGGFPSLLHAIDGSDWSSTSITLTGFNNFSRYLLVYRLFRDGCYQDYEVHVQIDGYLENKKYVFSEKCGLNSIAFDTVCHRSISGMHNFYFPNLSLRCGNGWAVHYYNTIFNSLPLISPDNGDTTRIRFSNQNDGPSCRGHYLVLPGNTPNGTYLYHGEYTNSCGVFSADVQVEISMPPISANGGTNQFICSTTTDLAGNTVGNPNWYYLSKSPAGANVPVLMGDSTQNLSLSNLSPDAEYRFVYRSWGGAYCESSYDTVVVYTASSPPAQPDAGSNTSGCYGTEITLSASPNPTQLGASGVWSLVSQVPAGNPPLIENTDSPFTTVLNTLPNTSYTFRYMVQNGCGAVSDDVVIQTGNTEGPNPPDAGPDQCLPSGTSGTMLAAITATPAGSTGFWTAVAGNPPGASIVNTDLPNTSLTGLITGTYRFVWTVTRPPCGALMDTVVVTIGNAGVAEITEDEIEVCNQATPATVTLQASLAGPNTGMWNITEGIPGAMIANPLHQITNVSGLLPGSYRFRWTVDNAACGSGYDEIIVRVGDTPPIVTAGNDTTLCPGSGGLILLNGTPPGNFSGYWSVVNVSPGVPSAGVTFVQNTTATQHNAVVKASPGRTRLRWTLIPSAPCSSIPSVDDILIDYVPPATLPNDTLKLCNATAFNLTGVSPGLSGAGEWTQTGGTAATNLPHTQEGNNPIVVNLPGGTGNYQFMYTVSSAFCSVSRDTLTVINFPQPPFPFAGVDDTLCIKDEIILSGSQPPAGYTVTWSIRSGPTPYWQAQFLPDKHSQNVIFKPVQAGVYIFDYSISNGGCTLTDAVRDSVRISTLNAGPDKLLCDDTSIHLGNAAGGQVWWAVGGNPSPAVVNPVTGAVAGMINEGIYSFQLSEIDGCYDIVKVNKTLAIHIDQQPIGDTLCVGGTLNVDIQGNALAGNLQYQWQVATNANGPFTNVFNGNASNYSTPVNALGAIYYRVLLSTTANTCKDTSLIIPVRIVPDQTITIQPQNIAVCEGVPIQLSAMAVNGVEPLIYQWQSSTSSLGPWTNISAADSPTFVPVSTPGISYYRMTAGSAGSGCGTANSSIATVTIDAPVHIVAQPDSIVECLGGNKVLDVTVAGSGISYQWQSAPLVTGPFTNVGSNQSSYLPPATITGTRFYRLHIRSTNNLCKDTSVVVPVEIFENQNIISEPQSIVACEGVPLQLSSTTSGGVQPLQYQWQSSTNPTGPWADITAANNNILTPASIPGTAYYRMTAISSGNGCNLVNTDVAIVTVDAAIDITAQTNDIAQCIGGNATLNVSTSGTGISYQWQSAVSETGPFTDTGNNQFEFIPPSSAAGTTYYRVQLSSVNQVCRDTSVTAAVVIVADQNITLQPQSYTDCLGTDIMLSGAANGGTSPLTYQWQVADSPVGPWITVPGASAPSLAVNTSVSDSAYYRLIVLSSGNGCNSAESLPALVQIGPSVSISQQPQNINECVGGQEALSINIMGGNLPLIQWQVSNDGGLEWEDIPGANTHQYIPATSQNNVVSQYRAIINDPTSPCGRDTSLTALVMVETAFAVVDSVVVCNFADGLNSTYVNFTDLVTEGDGNSNWQSIDGANPVGAWSQKDFSNVPAGVYRFVAITTDAISPCINVRDTVLVRVNTCCPSVCTNPVLNALCNETNNAFNLNSLICTHTQPGFWQVVAGPGITNAAQIPDAQFQINGISPGAYTVQYQLNQSPATCPQSSSQIIQITGAPEAGFATGITSLCQHMDTVLLLSELLNQEDVGGLWVSTNVPAENLNGTHTALNTHGLEPGNYALAYIMSAIGCPNDTSVVLLDILPAPFAEAGEDFLLTCDVPGVIIGNPQNGQSGQVIQWNAAAGSNILNIDASQFETTTPDTYFLQVKDTVSGCVKSDTVVIGVGESFITGLEAESKNPTCYGNKDASIKINTVSGGTQPFVFTLSGSQHTASNSSGLFYHLEAGQYRLELEDANGCSTYRDYTIEDPAVINAVLHSDTTIGCGDSIQLTLATNISFSEIRSMRWYAFGNLIDTARVYSRVFHPLQSTRYSIRLETENGCIAEPRATVEVDNSVSFYAPNVFKPDGDGLNEVYKIFFSEEVDHVFTFQIFDRWGNLMYRKDDFLPDDSTFGWNGWNKGAFMDPGVFVWFAEINACYGGKVTIKGDVTLVR